MGSQLSTLIEQAKENGGLAQEIAIAKVKANKDKELMAALDELAKHVPHLHALSVKECKLQRVPQEAGALLGQLAVLNLEHNKIATLPSMAKFDAHLRELHLPMNKLVAFPTTLQDLVQLAVLDLSSNAITEIPREMEKMRGLRSLNLSKNALTTFSPSLCLPGLTSLDLSENRLLTVPKQVPLSPLS
jgi:Leucine-rich repeat (LRR) protein